MSVFFEGVDLNPIGGDNLPQISITNVCESKASMMLLDLYYSRGIERYMKHRERRKVLCFFGLHGLSH